MPDMYAVAGSKIYIGGVLASKPTNFVVGDFAGQTWVEIDGWETAGAIGDAQEIINTNVINSARTIKQGGTKDAGTMENSFTIFPTDPGQTALKAAQGTGSNYAFRVIWSTGETQYFIALVSNQTRSGGGANDIQKLASTLEINCKPVTA